MTSRRADGPTNGLVEVMESVAGHHESSILLSSELLSNDDKQTLYKHIYKPIYLSSPILKQSSYITRSPRAWLHHQYFEP